MTVRRALILLTVLTLVLPPVFIAGYTQINASSSRELQTYVVSAGDFAITVPAYGSLKADEIVDLSFQASGQVVEVLVDDGDVVTAGDALVRLDNRAQYNLYEQANLNYELAARLLEDLLTVDDDDVREAQANLQSARDSYADVANAVTDADITAAELRYQQAVEALNAAEEARRQANPAVQSDEAIALLDAQVGEASFNAEIARLGLDELRGANQGELGAAAARITQAQAELDRVLAGPSEYEVEQAQAAVDQALITLDQARLSYDRTMLTAPFDGIVATANVELGQRVTAGVPVMQLIDVTPLIFRGEVDETDIQRIAVDMAAQAELDALPGMSFDGTVSWIAPQGRDENGVVVYDIEIDMAGLDARMRPGMRADAGIILNSTTNTIVIPARFIRTESESGRMFVDVLLPDGSVETREVTVGLRDESGIQITNGLHAGETIVIEVS